MFCALQGQEPKISDERSQDHWSSGLVILLSFLSNFKQDG